jgi:hypothetical protein
VADSNTLWGTQNQGTTFTNYASNLSALNITRPTSVEFIDNNGVDALLVGGLSSIANAQSPIAVADSSNGNLTDFRLFGSGLPNALVYQMTYNSMADVLAIATIGRGVFTLYDVTSYFPQALVLQFGLANNDSMPDASYLTDRKTLDGTASVLPQETASHSLALSAFIETTALDPWSGRFLLSSVAIAVTPARPPSCIESTAVLGTRTMVEFCFKPS